MIGQAADGIATPLVGYLSDQTTSVLGKRRVWIMFGSLLVALTFPFIFHSSPLFLSSSMTGRLV